VSLFYPVFTVVIYHILKEISTFFPLFCKNWPIPNVPSRDHTAKLWDVQGNRLADLKGHTSYVNSAVFSPDGKRIVTASRDGTAVVWPTPETIMDWLKTAPIPKLTPKEIEELGIADFY
jgi:WD40 repeat protein